MNNILVLVRRELWEHRSLWIAPLVVAGVLIIISALGGIKYGDAGNFWIGGNDHIEQIPPEHRDQVMEQMRPKAELREVIATGMMGMLTMVQLLTLGIVVFFYLLDTLLAERRDRSILFWKSLPISDGEVVASKALTALVAAPLIVYLVSAAMVLLCSAVLALRMINLPFSLWSFSAFLDVQVMMFGFIVMVVIWYLPLAGYLLVVSVWARKNAFLWAVLPPVALLIIEELITRGHFVAEFLAARFGGYALLVDTRDLKNFDDLKSADGMVSAAYQMLGQIFASYQIWVGALAGLALIYLAVRIRRFRDES